MPLPDLAALCTHEEIEVRISILMPGGARLAAEFPNIRIPNPAELSAALFAQVNASIAPLEPLFIVMEALISVSDCVKAVEKAIASFPPRPDKLAACFPKMAEKMSAVLQLVPPLSIPIMISGIIDALIIYFKGIRAQLKFAVGAKADIEAKKERVTFLTSIGLSKASTQLSGVVGCAEEDLNLFMMNMNAGAIPLTRLINDVNGLLRLAQLDLQIPLPAEFNISVGTKEVDAAIVFLQDLRTKLPDSGNPPTVISAEVAVGN